MPKKLSSLSLSTSALRKESDHEGDPNVVDYLNKALGRELIAVNQYWLHYRLLNHGGYKDLAKKSRKKSIEEMQHADQLTMCIIFLGGFPTYSCSIPSISGRP